MSRLPFSDTIVSVVEKFGKSFDAFGTPVTEGTREIIDQPGTLPVSRERYRYYEDTGSGYTRVNNPIPANTNNFSDNSNNFQITCPAGERRDFRTAERAQYQSGYEAEWGISWKAVNSLSDGQKVRIRLVDTPREDQIVVEYRNVGGTIEAEAYLKTASGKKNSDGAQTFTPETPLTSPRIVGGFSNFYGVGEHRIFEQYIEALSGQFNIEQMNNTKAVVGDPDDWSLESFNLHMSVELDCTESSSSLDVQVGTMSYKVRGDTPEIRRQKEIRKTDLQYDGTNNNYEPVLAARVDPKNDNITTDIPGTEIVSPAGNFAELIAVSVFPDEVTVNTNTGSWDPPEGLAGNSSVIQTTEDVTEIVDDTGTLAADIPEINQNMRQVSLSATSSRKATGGGSAQTIESPLHPDEVLVFLVKTDDGSSDTFNVRMISEENW